MMTNRRILVCDDDELLVDLLTYRRGTKGYKVSAARDGGQALERIAADKPDAVVLDAMMPVIDGFEVLRRIREQPETATLPVLMLSARKQERDIVGALQLGANDFVVKPFIPEELLARLARLLGEDER